MSQPGPTTHSKTSERDSLSHHLKQGMPSTVSELELLLRKIYQPITNAIKTLASTGYLDQEMNELNNQLVEQISKQNETIKALSDRVDNLQSEFHGSRTKSPQTNPLDKIPQTKSPWTKSPLGQNPPRQNPPGQNSPIISPQTVPLLNTFCFLEMLFSKASFLPPLLDVIYSMVMKWRSIAELSR